MTSFLKKIIQKTENEFASIAEDGIEANDVVSFYDTGCYALNALISGSIHKGIPSNKVIALAGDSGVGKTYLSLGIVKNFLEKNPTGICVYFESESAITSDMIEDRGIDGSRIGVVGVATVEEFRNQCIKVLDEYTKEPEEKRVPMLLVLDSLGMLSTSKEMSDTAEGKEVTDMTRARVIKSAFRVLTMKLGKANVPLIITNHTYSSMSQYSGKQISGGGGIIYAASIIVMLSKSKDKDGDEVVGNIIHARLDKGRFTKQHSSVDLSLRFDSGLNKYYGLLDIAAKHNVIKKLSKGYELPNGEKAYEKEINESPEKYFDDKVLEQVEQACQKEFKYGGKNGAV